MKKVKGHYGVICPHCQSPSVTRTSRQMTDLMREAYYQCSNLACGHNFVVAIEVVRSITTSATPNPRVNLPMVERGSIPPEFLHSIQARAPDPNQAELQLSG